MATRKLSERWLSIKIVELYTKQGRKLCDKGQRRKVWLRSEGRTGCVKVSVHTKRDSWHLYAFKIKILQLSLLKSLSHVFFTWSVNSVLVSSTVPLPTMLIPMLRPIRHYMWPVMPHSQIPYRAAVLTSTWTVISWSSVTRLSVFFSTNHVQFNGAWTELTATVTPHSVWWWEQPVSSTSLLWPNQNKINEDFILLLTVLKSDITI